METIAIEQFIDERARLQSSFDFVRYAQENQDRELGAQLVKTLLAAGKRTVEIKRSDTLVDRNTRCIRTEAMIAPLKDCPNIGQTSGQPEAIEPLKEKA